jgi:hypothetical protein
MPENALTDKMVRNLVLTWYSGTNEHRPIEELETLLSEDVGMRYPNKKEPMIGRAAFREWYDNVLNLYFDETHEVESWDIKLDGNRAVAVVIVRWENRSWSARAARGKYEAFLSRQRFEIDRSAEDGRVYIRKKIVETFERTSPIYGVGA